MFVIVTLMDDSPSDSPNQVFGPFKTKAQALKWAKVDRAKHVKQLGDENPEEVFYDGPDSVAFGEFVWQATKLHVAKMSKRA